VESEEKLKKEIQEKYLREKRKKEEKEEKEEKEKLERLERELKEKQEREILLQKTPEQEKIANIFDGICPHCKKKSEEMGKGNIRKCNYCEYVYDILHNFKEYTKEEWKNANFSKKICPNCMSKLEYDMEDEVLKCLNCKKIYDRNNNKEYEFDVRELKKEKEKWEEDSGEEISEKDSGEEISEEENFLEEKREEDECSPPFSKENMDY
jgi:hypothetical protein